MATKLNVYTVRIDFASGGMVREDVAGKDTVDAIQHLMRLIRLKERNKGINHRIKSVTIERE